MPSRTWKGRGPRPMTLEEARRQYEVHQRANGYSEKTIDWKNTALRGFTKFIKGTLGVEPDVSCVTRENVELYVVHLQQANAYAGHPTIEARGKKLSRQTVNCYVRALRAFSHFLAETEVLPTWFLANLKPPKTDSLMNPALSLDQVARMIEEVGPPNCFLRARNTAFVALLIDAGLRQAEAIGLRLGDVDFELGCVRVVGKGRRQRVVGVGASALTALSNYLRYRPDSAGDIVFVTASGEPMTKSAVTSFFVRLRKRLGLPRLHAHLLRHASATLHLQAGEDLVALQRQLGHSSITVTQAYIGAMPLANVRAHQQTSPLNGIQIVPAKRARRGGSRSTRSPGRRRT